MHRTDVKILVAVLAATGLFAVPAAREWFISATTAHPYLMSFVKFAALATFGESVGLRVQTGAYNKPGFGLLPRAFVWGVLGLGIKASFTIFSAGAPAFLAELGFPTALAALKTGDFPMRAFCALAVSASMNLIFAPILMTAHKITDRHIEATGGTLRGFLTPIPVAETLMSIDWNVMWGFVFKKTLPFFWIPAHTLVFLAPSHLQVAAAALLGVALGVVLALASGRPNNAPHMEAHTAKP